jgi:hypothetical protein
MVTNGTISGGALVSAFINGSVSGGVLVTGSPFLATFYGTYVNGSVISGVSCVIEQLGVNSTLNGTRIRGVASNWTVPGATQLAGFVVVGVGTSGTQLLSSAGSGVCSAACPAGTAVTFESPNSRACLPLPRLLGFDDKHSGYLPSQGPVSPGPSVAWSFAGNASERSALPFRFTTTPVVAADGTVYASAHVGMSPNSTVVFALDAAGVEKWRFVTKSASETVTSTDTGDFVFITSATYGSSNGASMTNPIAVSAALRSRTQLRTVVHLSSEVNFTSLFGNPLPGVVKELHVTYFDSVQVGSLVSRQACTVLTR